MWWQELRGEWGQDAAEQTNMAAAGGGLAVLQWRGERGGADLLAHIVPGH